MTAPVYLYTGPEYGMRDEAVDEVTKALKKKFGEIEEHVYYLNETSIGQAISQLDNGNLFASATCVICKNAELLKKKDEFAILEDWIKSAEASGEGSSALIFVSDEVSVDPKLDKLVPAPNKKKFWEMFDNQKIPWLTDYFRKNGYTLTSDAAQLILDMVDNNTLALKNECSRFFMCLEKGKTVTPDDVDSFLTHNREENAFTLFKQMVETGAAANKLEEALAVLQGIRLSKDSSYVPIIAGLASCFRKVVLWHKLTEESYGGYGADEATLKANGFRSSLMINQYKKAAKIWTKGQAVAILAVLSSTDMQLRSSGTAMEDILLQKMIYEIVVKKGASMAAAEYSTLD
ncbi:MAG: DNA polymerase III subunit delta [Treponema sp.]|nr:DNA polymerase III subunit delta [Treponema sp.]